MKRIG